MQGSTRRQVFKAIAGAAAGAQFAEGQHQHTSDPVEITGAYTAKVLTPAELEWVARLVDAIIPRTDTPGASDAGVPAFIDRRLYGDRALITRFREGMALLDAAAVQQYGAKFGGLDATQATAVLTPASMAPDTPLGRFFHLVKDLTIDGYYSSREGLAEELGWHGNTFLAEFPGCTHPEHQG